MLAHFQPVFEAHEFILIAKHVLVDGFAELTEALVQR
jgi:hypothetical protein